MNLLKENREAADVDSLLKSYLKAGIFACEKGVKRTHLVSRFQNGGVLSELFTRDGAGKQQPDFI